MKRFITGIFVIGSIVCYSQSSFIADNGFLLYDIKPDNNKEKVDSTSHSNLVIRQCGDTTKIDVKFDTTVIDKQISNLDKLIELMEEKSVRNQINQRRND